MMSGPLIDRRLADRAIALASQLEDQVAAYLAGTQLYQTHGNAEAKEIAERAKTKLIELLTTPYGL